VSGGKIKIIEVNMVLWDFSSDKESSFEPIPAGVYNVTVTEATLGETAKGDQRLKVTFAVIDGEYTGRKIFEGYMMSGNEKAVQIGRGQVKSLLKVAGKDFNITGADALVGIELAAVVKVQAGKDGYSDKNAVSSFKPKVKVAESTAVPF